MIEKIVRSPLSNFFFLLLLGGLVFSKTFNVKITVDYAGIITIGILLLVTVYFFFIYIYNRNNPNHKVKWLGSIPSEFKEEDEGKQWITFQACRKVYIFYSLAIPTSILLISLWDSFSELPLVILLLLGLSQYGIFWWEERKYNQDEAEE